MRVEGGVLIVDQGLWALIEWEEGGKGAVRVNGCGKLGNCQIIE